MPAVQKLVSDIRHDDTKGESVRICERDGHVLKPFEATLDLEVHNLTGIHWCAVLSAASTAERSYTTAAWMCVMLPQVRSLPAY